MSYEYTIDQKAQMLREIIAEQEVNLQNLKRKRNWRPSEVAMAGAAYTKRIEICKQITEDLHRLEGLNK